MKVVLKNSGLKEEFIYLELNVPNIIINNNNKLCTNKENMNRNKVNSRNIEKAKLYGSTPPF